MKGSGVAGRSTDALESAWTLILLSGFVSVIAGVGSMGPGSMDRTIVTMLINVILVTGLYVFIGNSGVFSFGHIAFMAIGAYTASIGVMTKETKEALYFSMPQFLVNLDLPVLYANLLAAGVAAVVAVVIALPLMRLSGLTASLGTFGFLVIVYTVANNWTEVTNASSGFSGIPTTVTVWTALPWVIASLTIAFVYQQSQSCLRLRASREDEVAARSIGVRITVERTIAFGVSAFIVGLGGALYAESLGSIQPVSFYLTATFLTIAMLVVGGVLSLSGAVVGVIVLTGVSEALRRVEQGVDLGLFHLKAPSGLRELGFAAVMLAILMVRPNGLTGGREIVWPFGRRGDSTPDALPAGKEGHA